MSDKSNKLKFKAYEVVYLPHYDCCKKLSIVYCDYTFNFYHFADSDKIFIQKYIFPITAKSVTYRIQVFSTHD